MEYRDIGDAWRYLESAGLRRPDELRPDDEDSEVRKAKTAAILDVWLDILAPMTRQQLFQACRAYLLQPLAPSQWSRPWPDPGRLVQALSEASPATDRRRIETNGDKAWEAVVKAARNSRNPPARYSDDPTEDARIRRGLEAVGGLRALGMTEEARLTWTKRTFVTAYKAEAQGEPVALPNNVVPFKQIKG
jgi:hypothetical protein